MLRTLIYLLGSNLGKKNCKSKLETVSYKEVKAMPSESEKDVSTINLEMKLKNLMLALCVHIQRGIYTYLVRMCV